MAQVTVVYDKNDLPNIAEHLKDIQSYYVEIGVFGEDDAGTGRAMIANVHEYGIKIRVTKAMRGFFLYRFGTALKKTHITIPERSFVRAGYDGAENELFQLIDRLVDQVVHLELTPEQMYDQIGLFLVGEIQAMFAKPLTPGLSAFTKKHKDKNKGNPLVNTSWLRQGVVHKVRSGVI